MLLILAATFTALGFVGWIVGTLLEMPGVAVISAILVVGVGAGIMTDGLDVRDGHVETNTTDSQTEVAYTYAEFEPNQQWPLGELWLLLGGIMTLRGFSQVQEL